MKCSACQHDNEAVALFCEECGSKLAVVCASCGTELKSTAKFCLKCGARRDASEAKAEPPTRRVADYTPKHLADKILQSRSALEGERKQVTVLFADVKGSMALAGQVGAEEWHRILDHFFAILAEGIHRYEGTVNQYTGDGIMALFGAPIAHEDHAQRACYAAIQLRDRLKDYADQLRLERGLDFGVRMGLNSGDVVVGRIGDELRMDYTAQGHTVGLAQRIEQLAGAERICLSEHTQRLVAGYFALKDLGTSSIAGVDTPVRIFELEGASRSRTRLDVARARGLTRFVGRAAEMQILETVLARARGGHGQVVGVVGEPGLGKSRLCFEFIEHCKAWGLPVYEAHCPAHGKNIPFLPILELFRNYYDIKADDTAAQARKKIAGTLTLLDPALQDTLPTLFEFMGVGDPNHPAPAIDADARQRQLISLLHRIYRIHAQQAQPTVVLIDDLHWIDPGSDVFVAQLVAATEGSRSLLLLNFRPEYAAAWMRSAHYQQLPLVPLSAEELRDLVGGLLGNHESVQQLAGCIVEWTGGNPFYTEEVIQSLIEMGDLAGVPGAYRLARPVDKLEAPPNVRAVLAARIDRLPDGAKQLLQMAAVIGKGFSANLLAAIDGLTETVRDAALERLKSAGFLFEQSLYPVVEYAFKHPLTHEVAYDTLLKNRRENVHRAVAEAIAARDADKLDERAALLAYHWEHTDQFAQAAQWHRRAAL